MDMREYRGPSCLDKARERVGDYLLPLFWWFVWTTSPGFRNESKKFDLEDPDQIQELMTKFFESRSTLQMTVITIIMDAASLDFEDTEDLWNAARPHLKRLRFRAALEAMQEELDF